MSKIEAYSVDLKIDFNGTLIDFIFSYLALFTMLYIIGGWHHAPIFFNMT